MAQGGLFYITEEEMKVLLEFCAQKKKFEEHLQSFCELTSK
jgi:hypothetical protein